MRLLYAFMLMLGVVATGARAGIVVTREGTFSGSIVVENGRIGIEQEDGRKRWFGLESILSADFKGANGKTRFGHGLRGEYFSGRNFQKLMLVRNDPSIDFRWVETLPHPSLCPTGREFSVRWTGRLRPAHASGTEKYKIITTADDGVRVWLDERPITVQKPIIDRWWDQSANDYVCEVELKAGRTYELKVEYYNGPDTGIARLSWASANVPRQVIGPENLLLPEGVQEPARDKNLVIDTPATDGGSNFARLIGSETSGLRAEYFTDRELSQLAFIRFDPNIDAHYYNENPPDPTMLPEGSVRWTGMLEPRPIPHAPVCGESIFANAVPTRLGLGAWMNSVAFTGLAMTVPDEYRFHLEAHRRVRLWVNDRMLLDKWTTEGGEFSTEPIRLWPFKVPFKVEFSSSTGFMLCRARWSSPTLNRDVIPASAFSPPPDSRLSKPVIGLVYPTTNTMLVAPNQVSILATGVSRNGTVRQVEFFDRTSQIGGAVTAQPYRLNWQKPNPGVYSIRARLTDSFGVTALSDSCTLTITGRGNGTLPAPWGDFYITNNEHITMGVASMEGGRIRIDKATGTLLSNGDHDAGHFVVRELVGDGQIIARIASLAPKDPAAMAMAGITLRQNLRNRCKQCSLVAGVSPAGETGVHFIRRQETWTNPISTEKRMEVPCWVRLLRHGGRVYAYASSDGHSWELIGSERFDAAPQIIVGLVATAESKEKPASAVFEQVAVTAGSPAMDSAEKGFVTRAGTFVAAEVYGIEGNFLRYARDNVAGSVPLNEVARIVYKPVLSDHATRIPRHSTGLLMGSGDFLEGDIKSLQGDTVQVSSVLFGIRRVSIQEDVTAIVLREVEAQKTPYIVATTDQSLYRAKSISLQGAQLIIDDISLGRVSVPMGLLAKIRVP